MGYAKKLITKTNTWIFPRSPKHSKSDDDTPKSKMLSKVMSINILKADPSKFGISKPFTDARGNTRYYVTYDDKPVKFRTPKFTLKFNTRKFANNVSLQWFLDERQLDILNEIEQSIQGVLDNAGITGKCEIVKRGSKYGEVLRFKVPEYENKVAPKVQGTGFDNIGCMTSGTLCSYLTRDTGVNVSFTISFYNQSGNFYTPLTSKAIKITPVEPEDSDVEFSD